MSQGRLVVNLEGIVVDPCAALLHRNSFRELSAWIAVGMVRYGRTT